MSTPRIVIVGVGAIGSHLALFLRSTPGTLVLVDHALVAEEDTRVHFHAVGQVGRNRAQALQLVLHGLFAPGANTVVHAMPARLIAENATVLLAGATLVVDCTDDVTVHAAIRAFADKAADVPFVYTYVWADPDGVPRHYARWSTVQYKHLHGAPQPSARAPLDAVSAACAGGQLAAVVQEFLRTGVRVTLTHLVDAT